MAISKNFIDPISHRYLVVSDTSTGAALTSSARFVSRVRSYIPDSVYVNHIITSNIIKAYIHVDNSIGSTTPPLVRPIQIKLTTYPPVYKTSLGADKKTETNVYNTPRIHPPLLGSKGDK